MSNHKLNLPWSIKQVNGKDTATILDCEGIPIAHALYYTSLAAKQPEKGFVITLPNRRELSAPALSLNA